MRQPPCWRYTRGAVCARPTIRRLEEQRYKWRLRIERSIRTRLIILLAPVRNEQSMAFQHSSFCLATKLRQFSDNLLTGRSYSYQ